MWWSPNATFLPWTVSLSMRSFLAFQVPQVEVRCFVGPSHIFLPSSMHRIHGTSIFTYILLIFMVHVGKYIRPSHMDPIGYTGIRYTWQPASIRYTSAISHKHLDLHFFALFRKDAWIPFTGAPRKGQERIVGWDSPVCYRCTPANEDGNEFGHVRELSSPFPDCSSLIDFVGNPLPAPLDICRYKCP